MSRVSILFACTISMTIVWCSVGSAQPAPVAITDFPIVEGTRTAAAVPNESASAVLAAYKEAVAKMRWDTFADTAELDVASTSAYMIPQGIAMQIVLKKYDLGPDAFLFITTKDEAVFQRMTQRDLQNYAGKSAFLPTGKLMISVLKKKDSEAPAINIEKIRILSQQPIRVFQLAAPTSLAGLRAMVDLSTLDATARDLSATPETICGNDDRTRSSDRRVGRLMPIGCTGWLIGKDLALSAGHCAGTSMDIIEFQVPDSTASGSTQPASVNDQYPVLQATMRSQDAGIGNDWVVFKIGPNSNTGQLPGDAQGGFFKLSRSQRPEQVRVTGFGLDSDPQGTTGNLNGDNQTQQTENGNDNAQATFNGNGGDAFFRYRVDTRGGNSGSPVIDEETENGAAIAIHTHGGCAPGSDGNHGTSASNEDLREAIKEFVANLSVVYVD